jgi:hypothetical protein
MTPVPTCFGHPWPTIRERTILRKSCTSFSVVYSRAVKNLSQLYAENLCKHYVQLCCPIVGQWGSKCSWHVVILWFNKIVCIRWFKQLKCNAWNGDCEICSSPSLCCITDSCIWKCNCFKQKSKICLDHFKVYIYIYITFIKCIYKRDLFSNKGTHCHSLWAG